MGRAPRLAGAGVGHPIRITMASAALVKQLAKFSTCEVADALIKLKLPHGGFLPGIDMYSPQFLAGETSICGPAFTVKVGERADRADGPPERDGWAEDRPALC